MMTKQMKIKFLFLVLVLCMTSVYAQETGDTVDYASRWDSILLNTNTRLSATAFPAWRGETSIEELPITKYSLLDEPAYLDNSSRCVMYKEYTDWEIIDGRNGKEGCYHNFVYADHADVNTVKPYVTLEYWPCGRPTETVIARVCKKCGKNEMRKERVSYTRESYTSEYRQTLDKFNEE